MKKIKKAVVTAAGLGTRFLPITKVVPKPMLPVLDKPTIQYILEELDAVDINDVAIIVSPRTDIVKKHFSPAPELEKRLLEDGKEKLYKLATEMNRFNITFIEQKVPNGLAGAMLCAEEFVGDEPFLLLLGDELLYAEKGEKPCLRSLLETYEKTGKTTLSALSVFGDDVSKYGNMGVESEKDGVINVNRIVEKPPLTDALSNYAIIGRYAIGGEVLGILKTLKPRNNEIYLTDAFDILAGKGELVATEFEGKRFDVGDKAGYVKANVEFALKSEETGEEIKEYIKAIAEKL